MIINEPCTYEEALALLKAAEARGEILKIPGAGLQWEEQLRKIEVQPSGVGMLFYMVEKRTDPPENGMDFIPTVQRSLEKLPVTILVRRSLVKSVQDC